MSNILDDIDIHRYTGTANLDIYIQQQLFNNWNPVLPSTFHGGLISNYTFNINVYNNNKSSPSKQRHMIIEDDSHDNNSLNGYFNSHSPPTCKMLCYVKSCSN